MSDPLAPQLDALAEREEVVAKARESAQFIEQRTQAAQRASKLAALLSNPNVQWWVDEILRPKVLAEHEAALDPKNGKDACWNHIQRHAIAKEMADSLQVESAEANARLDSIMAQQQVE